MRTVLGLDLGTSSIGWALFELGSDDQPCRLVDLGVRHFEEVIEPKGGMLKNAKRRQARQMRKNLRRKRQRRNLVLGELQRAGLVSDGECPFSESESVAHLPYKIRSRAVEEKVSLEELGRAFYHLSQRRGFKSNRSAKFASLQNEPEIQELLAKPAEPDSEADENEGPVLGEISDLRVEMGDRTLGQFFLHEILNGRPVRGRHTDRAMYEEEFERIWDQQVRHYPKILTQELRAKLRCAIFDQRPLKLQKFLKAKCGFEPTKVCAERAQLISQRFRYWQDLANLNWIDPQTRETYELNLEQKHLLAMVLETKAALSWAGVRKELKLPKSTVFNLERSNKDGLKGNHTSSAIAGIIPTFWRSAAESEQEQLVEILLTVDDRGALYRTLKAKFGFTPEEAYRLSIRKLEAGTASLSAKAMRKITQKMMDGMTRSQAQESSGYRPWTAVVAPRSRLPELPAPTQMPNPRVRKALGQVRKVVNAIVATYGHPWLIRIEMARDLTLNKEEKAGLERANAVKAKDNKRAIEFYKALGNENPSRKDLFWHRLAEQCGWVCPYTGKPIPQVMASTARFTIEHIVPYSVSLDDSFNNLTLCDSETNAIKGARTPFEAFGSHQAWQEMTHRVSQWKGPGARHKQKLFLREITPDEGEMKSRQLNETRYICRKVAEFVRPVCHPDHLATGQPVQITKGQATAIIRTTWGLSRTISETSTKSREDLRHHAVDAVAIAFTSLSLFQRITHQNKLRDIEPFSDHRIPPAPAWLHHEVRERMRSVVISHEATRGIRDAFHKETAMGLRNGRDGVYHLRKPLESMTWGELQLIVDPLLNRLACEAYIRSGNDAKAAFGSGILVAGTLAHSARITKILPKAPMMRVPSGNPTKYFELGNNHHVEIFENEKGKRSARYVSMVDAARRVRRGRNVRPLPLVDSTPPAPGWRFVMSLCINDMIRLQGDKGDSGEYFRFQSIWSTTNQLCFRHHLAATVTDDTQRLLKSPGTLAAIKVDVDPIGRVREVPEGAV